MAVLMDEHVGVGDDNATYLLHPGDFGLVISLEEDWAALLISNHVIYVQRTSIEKIPPHPAFS
jgi:hypothetical protein